MEKSQLDARERLRKIISAETLIIVYFRTSHGQTIGLDFYAVNQALHVAEYQFHGVWISRLLGQAFPRFLFDTDLEYILPEPNQIEAHFIADVVDTITMNTLGNDAKPLPFCMLD
jgi:hypothetical protein